MSRLLLILFAFTAAFAFLGCASSESKDTTKEGREKYSTVPWNRPQNWEGKGVLGGVMQ
jgi:hypothetical protein